MTDLPELMNAVALNRFGGADELEYQVVRVPDIDDDEILVRVHTAGLGVWDPFEREGGMADRVDWEPEFPYVLGTDGSGTVVAVGDDVTLFEEGDRVYGSAFLSRKGGFYAEYTPVKEAQAAPVPEGVSMEEAGALCADGATALRGLRDELGVSEGDTLLIFGASGGVGHMALQLANRMGVRVLAMVSGADGRDLAVDLGASEVVQSREEDPREAIGRLAPNGLDAALVTANGQGLGVALAKLREGGRMAWPNGVQPVPEVPEHVEGTSYDGMPERELLDELNRLVETGAFTVHLADTFPLRDAARAHEALQEHYLGKLALRVEED